MSLVSGPEIELLLKKYDKRLPRYTSYPTAVELRECRHDGCVREALTEFGGHPLSMYVHIPFCRRLCWFCACNKIVTKSDSIADEYIDALAKELDTLGKVHGREFLLADLHFGGGSPTFLSPEQMRKLVEIIERNCRWKGEPLRSIELDPRTTTMAHVDCLRELGFQRASIGVQDFEPSVQKLVNRVQSIGLVRNLVDGLRDNGFNSINFDLIYGLPGQTELTMRRTLRRVIELQPDRIALYGYAHVTWRAKTQGTFEKHGLPEARERLEFFSMAERVLAESGYHPVGLDHFALAEDSLVTGGDDRKLTRNFMGYCTTASCGVLGIGVSSISDINRLLYQNHTGLDDYLKAVHEGSLPIAKVRKRNRDDEVRRVMIQEIMCYGELRINQMPEEMRDEITAIIYGAREPLKMMVSDGILVLSDSDITATFVGRFFLRAIASLFDAYMSPAKSGTFSAAI